MNELQLATWSCPTCKATTDQPAVCVEVAHRCASARRQVRMVRVS